MITYCASALRVQNSVMMVEDRTYFIQRAVEESEAAEAATCEEARRRHLEMAAAYQAICQDGPSILPVVPTRSSKREERSAG